MGTLEIIRRNGEKVRLFSKEPFCTLKSAAQNSSLMGDDNVQLSIVSSELLNLGKGDKIIVEGEEYTWLQVGQVVHLTPQRMILPQALTFLQ